MNKRLSLTTQAHTIIQKQLFCGDTAIDATTGNGYDTLFLAKQVGTQGKVFGFDLQQQAINSTLSRLENENTLHNVKLINACHSQMKKHIALEYHGKIKTIMFNLGYLPGSDKSIISQAHSTLLAIQQSLILLAPAGIISITAYPGHPGGEVETEKITKWYQQLNPKQYSQQLIYSSEKATAPRLFIIQKRVTTE
ncbi:MAG: class I SAM-dependent methyltransferase [Methylococcaceae bacterium]